MPSMDTYLTYGILPIMGQTVVVSLAFWWAVGEKSACLKAVLSALGVALLQAVLLLMGGDLGSAQRPQGFEMPFFVLVLLPLPLVFLISWLIMQVTPARAHEAVGVAVFAPLLPLFMRSSEFEFSPVLLIPFLLAFFLSFWVANMVANRPGGYVSRGGELMLSLAQVADCVVLLGGYLMVVSPLVYADERVGSLSALVMVAVLEFLYALAVLRCSLRLALFAAVVAGLSLPLWIMVIALTVPY